MAVGQARELLSSAHFLSLHNIHAPLQLALQIPPQQHGSVGLLWALVCSTCLQESKDVRRGRNILQMLVRSLPSDTVEADKTGAPVLCLLWSKKLSIHQALRGRNTIRRQPSLLQTVGKHDTEQRWALGKSNRTLTPYSLMCTARIRS